ncbi:cytochrome C biogenesis protein transmembrane region family protein [Asticcacaulis biprosthecium C19]|uniref:Cytochrome C biogenesis protein transmembrane region family protein n=2 Tax=Asticcacaulis biprosthecium TaxID=76891 RepID=F4QH26_9CAUL|nr:cytochrome C biogenesis protein transmembrane region family protein [Asticcacaulis biprosthecium C19]
MGLAIAPVQAAEGKSAHIDARLISVSPSVPQGGDLMLALDYKAAPGWHTYWINAGDTGKAPTFTWSLPDGVTIGDAKFPVPKTIPTFGLMSYGYEGRTVLLLPLRNGSKLGAGEALPLKARVDMLVCEKICIPESFEVSLRLTVGTAAPGSDAKIIAKAEKALPKPAPFTGTIAVTDGVAEFGFAGKDLPSPQDAYFFVAQEKVVKAPAPQTVDTGAEGFAIRTEAQGALPEGDLTGVLKFKNGIAYDVKLTRAPLAPGVYGMGSAAGGAADTSFGGILLAALGALAGGMILNLMPCVFPVLSMKLLALSRAGHDQRLARTEALAYGGGVILSFLALAGLIVLARSFGAQVGWGFQLQSPYVTAALALVMLLVALNMSGVFSVGATLQRLGGEVQLDQKRPVLSAFLTGVLAVVVAAPCTAPFMGPAIGVALTQGGLSAVTIFLALGLGFALPFVALTFLIISVPAVARALPRPGPWMSWLQRGLSVLMYGAALWLIWVFAQQVTGLGLGLLIAAVVLIVAGLVIARLPSLARIAMVVTAVVVTAFAAAHALPPTSKATTVAPIDHIAFGMNQLTRLRAEGKPVLVDMTAAWCVTCKVNEVRVLYTPEVADAFKTTGTTYMVGDWTNQDPEISRYLTLFGRSGVPLYVYYGPNKAEPKVLPQMLDRGDIVKLLKAGK